MDWLDDELKRAFERQEPPPDFAARTIARARRGRAFALPRWAAAAAAALAIAGAGYGYRWRQGEAAKQQVLLAFRIAATKVNHIQMQVIQIEVVR
jgi:type VI protein secretion system component VasF